MFDKFIKAGNEYTDKNKSVPAPYIRRSFTLDFIPSDARLHIAASGFYELYVNGENIIFKHLVRTKLLMILEKIHQIIFF